MNRLERSGDAVRGEDVAGVAQKIVPRPKGSWCGSPTLVPSPPAAEAALPREKAPPTSGPLLGAALPP